MRQVRLFCPDLTATELSPDESRHAATVLRCRRGDHVVLFDGAGREASAQITDVRPRRVAVDIGIVTEHPFDCAFRLTLAVAMGKAHRHSYLIEKCTELGLAALWPITTERSVTRPGDAAVERWQRRAIEAAKQSGRRWVPQIAAPQSLDDVRTRGGEFDKALIADPHSSDTPLWGLLADAKPGCSIIALIGPEGGWSDAERAAIAAASFVPVTLSPTILRTETAAAVLCAGVALRTSAIRAANAAPSA